MKNNTKVFIIDTSAVLSGKPINIENAKLVTTSLVQNELKPGGKDYKIFQFLKEKGLIVMAPSNESIETINKTSNNTGDKNRLSDADKEILALALDINKDKKEAIILTDDYSIQNIANVLKIKYQNISQPGITKKFKWTYQCSGCCKKFKENINICPICGASIKNIISSKKLINKK